MNGLDEAIDDIKMGRVTKHKNFEEYQKAVYQELGYGLVACLSKKQK
jgi:hypothetical protein